MLDLFSSRKKTAWFAKDQAKARLARKFIGRGSLASSTNAYHEAVAQYANTGVYSVSDIVFISAAGARRDRIQPDFAEIRRAIAARAAFVTDGPTDRNRSYNCGERQVASFPGANGCCELRPGWWEPRL